MFTTVIDDTKTFTAKHREKSKTKIFAN